MSPVTVRRVDFGYFVRPAEDSETGASQVEPCLGYLVDHPDGRILMDTGMGNHPEVDRHYRPHRKPIFLALGEVGTRLEDIRIVVNCHLHFDHCGNNSEMTGKPIVVQTAEMQAAQRIAGYTLAELVDAPGIRY